MLEPPLCQLLTTTVQLLNMFVGSFYFSFLPCLITNVAFFIQVDFHVNITCQDCSPPQSQIQRLGTRGLAPDYGVVTRIS